MSNISMYPVLKKDKNDYFTTVYTINSPYLLPGMVAQTNSNGLVFYSFSEPFDASVTFTIQNIAADGNEQPHQFLRISTPNLASGRVDRRTESYLSPKSVTQTFTDPMNRQWNYTFNDVGDMVVVQTPAGRTVTLTYDGEHRVRTYNNGAGVWRYDYSASNTADAATMVATDPLGKQRITKRTKRAGPASSTTDELNRTTTYAYDDFDRVTAITYPEGSSTTFNYDTSHRRVSRRPSPIR